MKKFLLSLVVLTLSLHITAGNSITLLSSTWHPFTSKNNPKKRLVETIVTEAFKMENINITIKYYPWERSKLYVKKGDEIATFPWWKTEKRDRDFILNKETILVEKEVFFHLKSLDFDWKNYNDLKKYKIGATIGYSHVKRLRDQGLELDIVDTEQLNFRKILFGRIDIYPSSLMVGYETIHSIFKPAKSDLFTNHPKPLSNGKMYMMFSRKNPRSQDLANKFDSGLRKLKKSGRYDKIISKYLTNY